MTFFNFCLHFSIDNRPRGNTKDVISNYEEKLKDLEQRFGKRKFLQILPGTLKTQIQADYDENRQLFNI